MERVACLMYHELEVPGRDMCAADPGYIRYVLPEGEFRAQMEALAGLRIRGVSVREMENAAGARVAITFDDGAETDLIVAAPILRALGHNATFFVSAGLLGKPGYLSETQLRELHRLGFEIGSHGSTHRYLSDLDPNELRSEIHGSKARIEAILGTAIASFSCPGGRWNAAVLAAARDAGFRFFSTSEVGLNDRNATVLRRIAIQRNLPTETFRDYALGRRLTRQVMRAKALKAAKSILGNSLYDRLWRRLQALRS